MKKLVLGLFVLTAIVLVPACSTAKKVMRNCQPTQDPKVFVNCEDV